MKIQRHSYALIAALAGAVALAGCNRDPEPATTMTPPAGTTDPAPAMGPSPSMETGPMTRGMTGTTSVTSITVGSSASTDASTTSQATLSTSDPIYVTIRTDGTPGNVEIAARLSYQDGQQVGEESETLNTSGPETTNISFRHPTGWPTGTYTVDVTVDGQPAGMSQQVEIR